MEQILEFNSKKYNLKRYPETKDNALRAWSSAELLALKHVQDYTNRKFHLFNDRFGVWNCTLHDKNKSTVWMYASQRKAIFQNLKRNNLDKNIDFVSPLDDLGKVDIALLKIPKSIELFELFLMKIHQASMSKTEVVCGFMTKYFSPAYIKVAERYFDVVEQSKAWKKARLLLLSNPKLEINNNSLLNTISWKKDTLQQYYGVFSSGKIDIGTQFLLEHLIIKNEEVEVLDVASGNGIISYEIKKRNPQAKLTLVDDFNLAIESSKLNLPSTSTTFICSDDMEGVQENYYDLIVSNPPFHFEHENNIEITLHLFKIIKKALKVTGRFVMVANKHLNYKTHLNLIFTEVRVLNENNKFVIYECVV